MRGGNKPGNCIYDGRGIKRLANNAGRGLKNFRWLAFQVLRRCLGNGCDRGNTRFARKGIGIARVDHKGARFSDL